jgi:hypothetical protein
VKVLALGLCSTCYTLKRQDEEYFGGLLEAILERDGYRCRVSDASGRNKRSIIVHHRLPGKSVLNLMLSLRPACHAKVHRTKAVLSAMPALLRELWREQHPKDHEQTVLNFAQKRRVAEPVPLFGDEERKRLIADSLFQRHRPAVCSRSCTSSRMRFPDHSNFLNGQPRGIFRSPSSAACCA